MAKTENPNVPLLGGGGDKYLTFILCYFYYFAIVIAHI